jgi:hypothetical protein
MTKQETNKRCFVISPIGEENSDVRKRSDQIFTYVIEKAVTKFGYHAIRADKIPKPGLITYQIIQHVLEDELMIADLTGNNPNVFYELAIRHMVRKPFIQIKDILEIIPFDIENMRTISFDYRYIVSMDKCRDEIVRQIEAIEKNPNESVESPISFSLDIKKLRNDTNPQSKILMDLASQIQEIKSDLDNSSKLHLSFGIPSILLKPSIHDNLHDIERDEKIIRDNLMGELCIREKNVQERIGNPAEFSIDEIIDKCLGGYSKDYVYQFISKFEAQLGYIEMLPGGKIRLTAEGIKHCQ